MIKKVRLCKHCRNDIWREKVWLTIRRDGSFRYSKCDRCWVHTDTQFVRLVKRKAGEPYDR